MGKIKQILINWRVIILLSFLLLGFFAINPNPWNTGVSIKAVGKNSSAELAGFENPKAGLAPMGHERIIAMNNKPILDMQAYSDFVATLDADQEVQVKTNKGIYELTTKPLFKITELNETEITFVNETIEVNETVDNKTMLVNKTVTKEVERPKILREEIGVESLGFSLSVAPTSNLRKGLDLQGGTRVLLKPAEPVDDDILDLAVDSLKQRLNVYGLADIVVRIVSDSPDFLGGNKFILVEIAGVTEQEVRDLIGQQGKFESKIGGESVFKGGEDITYVCRTAQCSGIDPNRGCGRDSSGDWSCAFMFSITLSPEAAKRQADLTRDLQVVQGSLSEQLVLFLDDSEVDRLNIAAELRGRAVTDIAITGGGTGITEAAAIEDSLSNMKNLQTILITGSLPVKLNIERIDNISPSLGREFLNNALWLGILSLLGVAITLMIVYRKFAIAIPIMITSLSEIFLTLAMAALIGWNIDLAAVAGLILAVGTGVDDQIVITDEATKKDSDRVYNWADRIKRAFFIIMSAYFTVVVAMIPLMFAGAGMLKGFAITTILAVTIGVLITRPAYAAVVRLLLEE